MLSLLAPWEKPANLDRVWCAYANGDDNDGGGDEDKRDDKCDATVMMDTMTTTTKMMAATMAVAAAMTSMIRTMTTDSNDDEDNYGDCDNCNHHIDSTDNSGSRQQLMTRMKAMMMTVR